MIQRIIKRITCEPANAAFDLPENFQNIDNLMKVSFEALHIGYLGIYKIRIFSEVEWKDVSPCCISSIIVMCSASSSQVYHFYIFSNVYNYYWKESNLPQTMRMFWSRNLLIILFWCKWWWNIHSICSLIFDLEMCVSNLYECNKNVVP